MKNKLLTNDNIRTPSLTFFHHLFTDAFCNDTTRSLDVIHKEYYKRCIITHCILLLSMYKEEIINKDATKKVELMIPDQVFTQLMGDLVIANGDKYKIGSIDIGTKSEILDLIRNKLLHGDYYIEEDKVVLISDKVTGSIKFTDLFSLCKNIRGTISYKLTGKEYRPILIYKEEHHKAHKPLRTLNDLKRLFKKSYFIDFEEEPVEGYERDVEYVKVLLDFYEELYSRRESLEQKSIKKHVKDLVEDYKPLFKKHHIKLSYKISRITKTPIYDQIEKIFIDNYHRLLGKSNEEIKKTLLKMASNLQQEKTNPKTILTGAIYNNINYLTNYILDKKEELNKLTYNSSFTALDDMTIAAVINMFYTTYHYPLDEILSNGQDTALKNIISGDNLDFSLLEIDELYDPNMTIDIKLKDLPNQLTSMKNAFPEQATKVCDLYKTYFKFLKSKSYEDEKVRNRVESNLLEKKNELEIERSKIEYADTFMTEKFDKFVINLNIIAHIRNALAHGNIKLRPYTAGDTFADRKLIIEDIHEGKMTYRKVLKVREFIQLFSEVNTSLVEETLIGRIVKIKLEEAKSATFTKK